MYALQKHQMSQYPSYVKHTIILERLRFQWKYEGGCQLDLFYVEVT